MNGLATEAASVAVQPEDSGYKIQALFNPILNDPILLTGVKLALPLVATGFLSSLIGIVDIRLAGLVGADAQAAVGIADQVLFMTLLVGTGLCSGVVACVSQRIGSGDYEMANRYAKDGLTLALVVGLVATLVGYIGAGPLLKLFHCSSAITENALPYLKYCSLANTPWLVALCQTAIFRAVGKTQYCLFAWTWMACVSILGSALLFFVPGLPGFHSLSALAYAWIVGAVSGVVVGWILARRISWNDKTSSSDDGRQRRILELLRIAAPAVVAELLWILSNFGMYRLLSDLPNAGDLQAAWSINLKLEETVASVPLLGLGMAAATITGQNTGAAQFPRARAGGWQLAIFGTIVMLLAGAALQAQSAELAGIFTASKSIASSVSLLLNGSIFALPFLSLWIVLAGGLEGAGLTKLSLAMNLVGLLMVRVPLAWLLSHVFDLGLTGVWLSVIASRFLMGILSMVAFASFLRAPRPQRMSA